MLVKFCGFTRLLCGPYGFSQAVNQFSRTYRHHAMITNRYQRLVVNRPILTIKRYQLFSARGLSEEAARSKQIFKSWQRDLKRCPGHFGQIGSVVLALLD